LQQTTNSQTLIFYLILIQFHSKNKIMKTSIFAILFAMGILSACSDSDTEQILGSFSATVNGSTWEASMIGSGAVFSDGNIVITGIKGGLNGETSQSITLSVFGNVTGTYQLNPMTLTTQAAFTYATNLSSTATLADTYIGTTGTVTITEISDNKISGTFNFNSATAAVPPVSATITNGKFENLNYTTIGD